MSDRAFNVFARDDALRLLPVFSPDAGLWPRVLARQLRIQRVQRLNHCVFSAAALIFACAAIVWLPRPVFSLQQEIAAGQRESSTLELQWQHVSRSAPSLDANLTKVHMIDADLQATYDRGGSAEDIAALWRQRNEVLRGLVAQKDGAEVSATALGTRI